MGERGAASVEVRPDVERRYVDDLQRRLRRTVWASGGCASWYLDESGRNTTLWPASTWRFRLRARRFDPADYVLRQAPAPSARVTGQSGAGAEVDPVPARDGG
jgi:cyclohexanone monooxygenase